MTCKLDGKATYLLIFGVEHGDDEDKDWRNAALEHAYTDI